MSWGFGLPMYDVIRGTVVDYMHCVCEGVVDQLISQWLNKSNSKQEFYLGSKVDAISMELKAITPTCEITRTPRSLTDVTNGKVKVHHFNYSTWTKILFLNMRVLLHDLLNICHPFKMSLPL